MKSLPKLLGLLVCSSLLVISSAAFADQGTVVLVGGQVLSGDIQQVVKGEYLIIKLSTGEVRAVAWADIGSFNFGGSVSVGGGGGSATPPPPPPPVYQPAPAPPPPTMVYAPPPPPPSYAVPPPPPAPPPSFEPTWNLGVRVGSMQPGGYIFGSGSDSSSSSYYTSTKPSQKLSTLASTGWMFEGDVGYHFSPAWTFYLFWEHGELGRGDLNGAASSGPNTNALGIGFNANTSPHGPVGFYFDIGASYRWMQLTQVGTVTDGTGNVTTTPDEKVTVQGFDPIRLGLGMSINVGRKFRIDPHVYASAGYFTRYTGGDCPNGCTFSEKGLDTGVHTLAGFAVSGRWDL